MIRIRPIRSDADGVRGWLEVDPHPALSPRVFFGDFENMNPSQDRAVSACPLSCFHAEGKFVRTYALHVGLANFKVVA